MQKFTIKSPESLQKTINKHSLHFSRSCTDSLQTVLQCDQLFAFEIFVVFYALLITLTTPFLFVMWSLVLILSYLLYYAFQNPNMALT